MSKIALNFSSYSNLLSLQRVSSVLNSTQNILATGLKVNSAIDNPSSYYTARSLNNRAADLSALLDNMGQKIQTIKAASEGIMAATSFLEQMTSVAEQALEILPPSKEFVQIRAGMSASEISALITDNAKILLHDDIILDDTLTITAKNVSFYGCGHTISFAGSGDPLLNTKAAIAVTGENASVDFQNIKIEATGNWAIGISSRNGAHVNIDSTLGINMSGENSYRISNRDELFYAGEYNTQEAISLLAEDAESASAVNNYYASGVAEDDETFGQGNWYLPSMGELIDVYGLNVNEMTSITGTSGADPFNKSLINQTLIFLKDKEYDTSPLSYGWFWSSTESSGSSSWLINIVEGTRMTDYKNNTKYRYARGFNTLEDVYNPVSGNTNAPRIGDIMYADKTWSSTDNYNDTKTVVGVISAVSADKRDVTIIGLDNAAVTVSWSQSYRNIDNIKNYNEAAALAAIQTKGIIDISNTSSDEGGNYTSGVDSRAYNKIYQQYNQMINDSSYAGINLLKGDSMEVIFNETRDNKLVVQGTDVSTSSLGLNEATWYTHEDVVDSISELKAAVAALRVVASDLGNHNSIIQTRQEFTESLINILEEGADKLTLADMNEASADMLSLQTRQQLAINALSLATQAEQNVLKLF